MKVRVKYARCQGCRTTVVPRAPIWRTNPRIRFDVEQRGVVDPKLADGRAMTTARTPHTATSATHRRARRPPE